MITLRSATRRVIVTVVTTALLTASLVVVGPAGVAAAAPAPTEERSPSTVTADVLPTVQIDSGVVWAQAIRTYQDAGQTKRTVYAGGSFSNARAPGAAPGTSLTPRGNLLAYDLATGSLITSFAPVLNGQVKSLALSPDGNRLYVGGSFSTANGATRFNLATYDTRTGQLVNEFRPAIGGSYVNAIAATADTVYVGGLLSAGNGVTRKNLMAFNASDGALKDWAPTTDLQVDTMVLTPGNTKLIVGGRFGQVNNQPQRGMAALHLTSGAILPWAAPNTVQNGLSTGSLAGRAGIFSLSTDGESIFGTGWVYANVTVGNLEGSFKAAPESGEILWLEDCHGDTYGAYSDRTNVYEIGHKHDCVTSGGFPQLNPAPGNLRHAVAFTNATKGTLSRSPSSGTTYKDWSGQPAPAMINWFPEWVTGSATGQGQAAWTVTGAGDYVVMGGEFPYVNGQRQQGLVRFGRPTVAPKAQGPRLSGANWVPSLMSFQPGSVRVTIPTNWDRDDQELNYRLVRNDNLASPVFTSRASSNFWNLPKLTFTDTGLTPGQTYSYRLYATDDDGNQAVGSNVQITVTTESASPYSLAVLQNQPSLFWRLGESSGTTAFDWAGTSDGLVRGSVTRNVVGAIAGDSNRATGFDGTSNQGVSTQSAIAGPNVVSLQAWFRTTTSSGGKIIGFGNATSGNSSNHDRSIYLQNNGQVRFGVYNGSVQTVVSPGTYRDGNWHQVVGTLGPNGLRLYVDGVQVAANAGVTSGQPFNGYWRVGGDNVAGWPSAPTSGYFNGSIDDVAIYPTVLTAQQISDMFGLASSGAATAPTANFTTQVTNLSVAFNGSGSTAASGQIITGYNWNFGDETASGSGQTVNHTYVSPGTYNVTLTVTDGRGVTGSRTVPVTVSPAPAQVVAADTFGRTQDPGWGTAETGGAWSGITGLAVGGGVGRLTLTAASQTRTATLPGVSATNVDARIAVALDKVPDGSGAHLNFMVRKTSSGDYRLKLRYQSNGSVLVSVAKLVGTTETLIATGTITGYTAGQVLNLRLQVTGNGPTTLRAKAWRAGDAEPSSWLVSTTHTESLLQSAGQLALSGYLTGSATVAPLVMSVDDLQVIEA